MGVKKNDMSVKLKLCQPSCRPPTLSCRPPTYRHVDHQHTVMSTEVETSVAINKQMSRQSRHDVGTTSST